jgi:tetratricopeptide (TPR) repeat protein
MRRRIGGGIVLLMACLGVGCATTGSAPASPAAARGEQAQLDDYIARVRARAQQALPARPAGVLPSIESTDPELRTALAWLAAGPTPLAHRAVAAAYLKAHVTDRAFDHYTAAVRLDRTDATSYDALARIWRDWGFPHLGLSDAHRAIFHAPGSASARNTLGTLLQALGMAGEARDAYRAALALDPQAAYAFSNLCTLELREAHTSAAEEACRRALAIDPALLAARRNLALVQAVAPAAGARTASTATPPAAAASVTPPGW